MVSEIDLKLKEMQMDSELNAKKIDFYLEKMKQKGNKETPVSPVDILLGLAVAGGAAVSLVLADKSNVFGNNPDGKFFWERWNSQPTLEKPVIVNEEEETEEIWKPQPHYTREMAPPTQLTYKMAHSSVTVDPESVRRREQHTQTLSAADAFRRQEQAKWKPKTVTVEKAKKHRLTYSSGGGSRIFNAEELAKIDERLRRKT